MHHMEVIQLKLFEEQKGESIYSEYFFKHFGWIPRVGENACIQTTLAIDNLNNHNKLYSMFARVIIKSIIGDEAICETTDEWCKEVEKAQGKLEPKDLFRVKLKDLGIDFKTYNP